MVFRFLSTRNLHRTGIVRPLSAARQQDIVQIITQLILNAAPSSDQFVRRKRYARGLVLWATLLKMMSEYEAKAIEQASMRWPLPLRQRFASARRYRTQRRWPYTSVAGQSDLRSAASMACIGLEWYRIAKGRTRNPRSKGTMSEFEISLLRQRAMEARRQKVAAAWC